jgi:hypothetical protein
MSEAVMGFVPAAERLTLAGVLTNATPQNELIIALLIAAAIGSIAAWAMALPKVAKGEPAGLGFLKIVRAAGPMLGFLGAALTLLNGFIGMANVRPAPGLTILAPGWAEATLQVVLGLLAATIATVCEQHLEAKVRRAARS